MLLPGSVNVVLQKMKMELENFKVDITGERNTTPPQHFKTVNIILHLTGKNLNTKKVAAVDVAVIRNGKEMRLKITVGQS
jgi:uncharacterized OsmC-like protein